ncbi:MAG: transposase [Polyangiaceae bacterium]|nr:transposase [Polyangiaceae bacterium]
MTPAQRARIIAEAECAPSVSEVAKRHGIATGTLRRWRREARLDATASAEVHKQRSELMRAGWVQPAAEFLVSAFRKMQQLTESAKDPRDIRVIAGAVKITAEALTVREALQYGQQPSGDLEGPPAPPFARGAGAALEDTDPIH